MKLIRRKKKGGHGGMKTKWFIWKDKKMKIPTTKQETLYKMLNQETPLNLDRDGIEPQIVLTQCLPSISKD